MTRTQHWPQDVRNDHATEAQFDADIDLARRQAELLRQLAGLVDPAWLESKARQVVARALGENPDHAPDRLRIVVEHLDDHGVAVHTAVYTETDLGDQVRHGLTTDDAV